MDNCDRLGRADELPLHATCIPITIQRLMLLGMVAVNAIPGRLTAGYP